MDPERPIREKAMSLGKLRVNAENANEVLTYLIQTSPEDISDLSNWVLHIQKVKQTKDEFTLTSLPPS